jgi:heme exporter protein D
LGRERGNEKNMLPENEAKSCGGEWKLYFRDSFSLITILIIKNVQVHEITLRDEQKKARRKEKLLNQNRKGKISSAKA